MKMYGGVKAQVHAQAASPLGERVIG